MTETAGEYVKVRFHLEPDEHGWPPASSEGLWGLQLSDDLVELTNSPWFVLGIANGDVVRTRIDEDGMRWFVETVRWSGCCTIRVIPHKDGPLAGSLGAVIDLFTELGASGEGLQQYRMVSLEVPADIDLAAVKRLLVEGERDGRWAYEEGCIGDAWRAAG